MDDVERLAILALFQRIAAAVRLGNHHVLDLTTANLGALLEGRITGEESLRKLQSDPLDPTMMEVDA